MTIKNIETEVAVMKNDITYIKDSVDELKETLKCMTTTIDHKANKEEVAQIKTVAWSALVGLVLMLLSIIGYLLTNQHIII